MSPMLKEQLHLISEKVHESYSNVEILLFGSTAKNRRTPDSDIDLCFIFDNPKERLRLLSRNIRKEIFPILHKPLDILVYDRETFEDRSSLPMTLEAAIKEEGKAI